MRPRKKGEARRGSFLSPRRSSTRGLRDRVRRCSSDESSAPSWRCLRASFSYTLSFRGDDS